MFKHLLQWSILESYRTEEARQLVNVRWTLGLILDLVLQLYLQF